MLIMLLILGILAGGWWTLGRAQAAWRGTTLSAAIRWGMVAWGCESAALVAGMPGYPLLRTSPPERHLTVLEFMAATATFCPIMAVLGARRPQHAAWQWIVLTLWIILLLPLAEQILFAPGAGIALGAARGLFLAALWVIALANYLPTRHCVASLLAASGQACFFVEQLPWLPDGQVFNQPVVGTILLLLAMALAARPRGRDAPGVPLEAAWVCFRDAYGAVWALRIMDRVRESARGRGVPVQLAWTGFVPSKAAGAANGTAKLRDDALSKIQPVMVSLLRKFVGDPWLAQYNLAVDNPLDHATTP